jgi:uncharacterized protein YkwD
MIGFKTTLPLLFLTLSLLLPKGVQAQPAQFSANPNAYDVIAAVNAIRAERGLVPYQVNSILMAIAQSHAEYQASSGVVTHYGANGSRPYQRAIAAGYSVAGDLSSGGFFAENIQSGADLSALDVVKIWQADSIHLNVMISPNLKDVGVGVAIAGGVAYYTLDAGLSSDSTIISPPPAGSGDDPFASPTATRTTSQPVATSTALEDGTVYHIVQANEALWSIALAYDTTVAQLKKLNKLATDDIFVGQKLLISKVELDTPTPQPSITVTLGIPTSTATKPVTPSPTFTATPIPIPPASRQSGTTMVGGIIFAAFLAAGLGAWFGRKKSK